MITREEILKEIRRTAKDNAGVPLGHERFKKETGIKTYDWMKFWPRFSEAQLEAGFKPNKLQGAYSDEFLYEKLISLTRELKKIPVRGDLMVKENNDKNFPAHGTFDRLGTKQKLIVRLLEYSVQKNYKDMIELFNSAIREEDTSNLEPENSNKIEMGTVYLAKSGRYYKIGRTNSMGRRHHEITILLPEGLTLIHEIKTDDPSGIETYWHNRFESKHKNGEWFDLNSSDVKAFKRWKKLV